MRTLLAGFWFISRWKYRKVLYTDSPAISFRYYKEIFNYTPLLIHRKKGVIKQAFLFYNQQIIEVKHNNLRGLTNECVLNTPDIHKAYLELAPRALILKPLMAQAEKRTFSIKDANGNVLHYQQVMGN